jgi:predicted MFS family arabinose efflux permease
VSAAPRPGSRAAGGDAGSARELTRWTVALAGAASLAVAMGIGRFAFTPLLPMMLHDGVVDLAAASWLASANYLGYLAGALLCTFQPRIWSRLPALPPVDGPLLVRIGLVATAVLTLGMAWPAPAAWPALRFAAGVASALAFVFTSGWCLAQLARLGAPSLGGVMYTGPGVGIALSGLFASALVGWDWRAATGWLIFGALAGLLTASVWQVFKPSDAAASEPVLARPTHDEAPAPRHGAELWWLALAYGLAGFGYIVSATFLPVIAREALPGSAWLDLFWPLFGAGVILGALLAARLRVNVDLRLLLAAGYLVQAAGVAASVWLPSVAGFALGSLLLGLPFTAITFFAMQEVRRLRPLQPAAAMGLLTALYGIGQIVGPLLVAQVLRLTASTGRGFTLSLQVASGALLVGAAVYLWMARAYPVGRRLHP